MAIAIFTQIPSLGINDHWLDTLPFYGKEHPPMVDTFPNSPDYLDIDHSRTTFHDTYQVQLRTF